MKKEKKERKNNNKIGKKNVGFDVQYVYYFLVSYQFGII
jgi:hypothetical protein